MSILLLCYKNDQQSILNNINEWIRLHIIHGQVKHHKNCTVIMCIASIEGQSYLIGCIVIYCFLYCYTNVIHIFCIFPIKSKLFNFGGDLSFYSQFLFNQSFNCVNYVKSIIEFETWVTLSNRYNYTFSNNFTFKVWLLLYWAFEYLM